MKRLSQVLLVVMMLAGLLLAACSPASTDTAEEEPVAASSEPEPEPEPEQEPVCPIVYDVVTVTNVVDGDTIDVRFEDGTEDRIRLIGIDTPEDTTEKDPYGSEATAYTVECLLGKTVYLETDAELRDRYDRQLAYVWLELPAEMVDAEVRAKLFNAMLLLDGYAQVSTYPPNVKYVDYFTACQEKARNQLAGLWALLAETAEPEPPPVAAPAPEPDPAPSSSTVYVTNTGAKYHLGGCRYLSSSKIPISLSDAILQGYDP